jgi:hypothetical protein
MKCPASTQDVKLNLKNRNWAFKNVGYGPANPDYEETEFWAERAKEWNTTEAEAKSMRCGNCAAFIVTPEMLDCIVNGLGSGEGGEEFPGVVSSHTGIALQCRFRGQAFAWEALTFAEQFSDPAQQFGIGACLPA